MLSSVARHAVPYFCALSHKRHGLRGVQNVFNIKWKLFIFSTTTFIILRMIRRGSVLNVYCSLRQTFGILVRWQ